MKLTSTSEYLSLILRHKPQTIGITFGEHGWANVDELIAGIKPMTAAWKSWRRSSARKKSRGILSTKTKL